MPKLIPEGGKRDIQIKVHLNKPESFDLEDLAKFYGSDRASALRKLLANWSFLQQYISSLNELIFVAKEIYKNREELNLSKSMTGKILDLISIGDRLSEETLNKKKTNNENIIKGNSLEKFADINQNGLSSKIVILEIYDLFHAYKVLDYLLKENNVICYFAGFNNLNLEEELEFQHVKKGLDVINAKFEKISKFCYLFSLKNSIVEKFSFSKFTHNEEIVNEKDKDDVFELEKNSTGSYGKLLNIEYVQSPKSENIKNELENIREKIDKIAGI